MTRGGGIVVPFFCICATIILNSVTGIMFRIRGHTLLCLQGFKGRGYNESFVANMKRIHEALFKEPETKVEVVIGPDDICSACPHLKDNLCTLNGLDTESDVIKKDSSVIALLGIFPARQYTWREILSTISQRLNTDILKGLCSRCQWLPFGYCEEGIIKLQNK